MSMWLLSVSQLSSVLLQATSLSDQLRGWSYNQLKFVYPTLKLVLFSAGLRWSSQSLTISFTSWYSKCLFSLSCLSWSSLDPGVDSHTKMTGIACRGFGCCLKNFIRWLRNGFNEIDEKQANLSLLLNFHLMQTNAREFRSVFGRQRSLCSW